MRSLGHVGVSVPDIDRAIRWYCDVLGLDLIIGPDDVEAGDGHAGVAAAAVFGASFRRMRIAHLGTANGVGVELFEFIDPRHEPRRENFEYWKGGFFHICVLARDIDELVARIVATGGRRRTDRIWEAFEDEPYRWCYCEDPFGNVIELHTHSDERVYSNR